MFVGITLPFFDGLLGFLGGFGFAPNTYFVRNQIPHCIVVWRKAMSLICLHCCSCHVLYGLLYSNQGDSACLGLQIG